MRRPLDARAATSAVSDPRWQGVEIVPRTPSTNALVVERDPWHVVVTDHQTAGRGRLGRTWVTPPQTSLTLSALVPTPADPDAVGWAPLLAGLAVHEALDHLGLATALKWPNDVLVPADEDRKVCGILCESQPAGIVVGIGLNVLQTRVELPVPTATSLALCGLTVHREPLLGVVLDRLADRMAAMVDGGAALQAARSAYRSACSTVGLEVELHRGTGAPDRALAVGVDGTGRLLVRDRSGEYAVAAGDVVHLRPAPGAGRQGQ